MVLTNEVYFQKHIKKAFLLMEAKKALLIILVLSAIVFIIPFQILIQLQLKSWAETIPMEEKNLLILNNQIRC